MQKNHCSHRIIQLIQSASESLTGEAVSTSLKQDEDLMYLKKYDQIYMMEVFHVSLFLYAV